MAIKVYEETYISNIAQKIREKTGGVETYNTREMPSGVEAVFQKGISEGIEQGKQAEYDAFWEVFQSGGQASNYYYAFAYDRFSDDTYNPKYPLHCRDGTTPGRYIFYNSLITDTKVEIVANSNNIQYAFYGAENLVTIRKLTVFETTDMANAFGSCKSLENIVIGGTIGKNISFAASPLTAESIKSIIGALSTTTSGLSATFLKTAVNTAFETSEGANDGSTSVEWLNLIDTKPNWTISLV